MHANWRPGPPFKQRFEFGALEVRGSSWATDWLHTVRGLNELAHTAGAPCAGAPASVPCRSKENKKGKRGQHLNVMRAQAPIEMLARASPAARRFVPLGSLRSPSFHKPPGGNSHQELNPEEKSDTKENI